jgi:hypothetical protein
MNQYYTKLGIYSEKYSAEDINNILGVKFDKCWVMGMPRSARSDVIFFEKHAWFIVSEMSYDTTLDCQIENIFERIKPSVDKLKDLFSECEIVFNCSVEGDENPILNFPHKIIEMMNSIQASLDIDLLIV